MLKIKLAVALTTGSRVDVSAFGGAAPLAWALGDKMESMNAFDRALAAYPYAWDLALALFIAGGFVLAFLVKRENQLSISDTALCMLGFKRFQRTPLINVCHALTIAAPIGIMLWAIKHA